MRKKKPGRPAKPKTRYYVAVLYGEDTLEDLSGPFASPEEAINFAEDEVANNDRNEDTEFVVMAASTEKFSFQKPVGVKLDITKADFV